MTEKISHNKTVVVKGLNGAPDELRDIAEELEAKAAPASSQDEPFGYFRVDALGWTDCAATDEGAIALYERPAAPAVPNVMKRGYGRLIQAAADLALQQFMPSDIVDDYPSKTISAAKVAKMMTQPRDRLRLLSIEVSEGAKQMLAATPATPSQEHAVNLSCRSTQARLAAQWGYVPAPSQPAVPGVEMPLSMNQFGRLVELTREHLSDNTFVYKATSKTGDTCHFGVESAAKAWAKGGTVEAIKVREFKLHTPPAAPSQPAVPQGEPVYQLARATGPVADAWIDVAKDVYDDAGFHPSDFKRRILYAAPSQPVTLTDGLIERGAMTGMVDAQIDAIVAALREKEALR